MYLFESLEEPNPLTQSTCRHGKCHSTVSLEDPLLVTIDTPLEIKRSSGSSDIADGVMWEVPTPLPPNVAIGDPSFIPAGEAMLVELARTNWNNLTADTSEAFPVTGEVLRDINRILMDAYQVSVPASKMADCLEEIKTTMNGLKPDNGVRGGKSSFRWER